MIGAAQQMMLVGNVELPELTMQCFGTVVLTPTNSARVVPASAAQRWRELGHCSRHGAPWRP